MAGLCCDFAGKKKSFCSRDSGFLRKSIAECLPNFRRLDCTAEGRDTVPDLAVNLLLFNSMLDAISGKSYPGFRRTVFKLLDLRVLADSIFVQQTMQSQNELLGRTDIFLIANCPFFMDAQSINCASINGSNSSCVESVIVCLIMAFLVLLSLA